MNLQHIDVREVECQWNYCVKDFIWNIKIHATYHINLCFFQERKNALVKASVHFKHSIYTMHPSFILLSTVNLGWSSVDGSNDNDQLWQMFDQNSVKKYKVV